MAEEDGCDVWPLGGGEMAQRIRAHDWAATWLGPKAGWSPRLRVMVELVLASPLPATLHCGRTDRIMLYNDAAAQALGSMHPAAFGAPDPEALAAMRVETDPVFARAFAGETVRLDPHRLPFAEQHDLRSFDLFLTPIREEDGGIAYVLGMGLDVRARLAAEAERNSSLAALRTSEQRLAAIFDNAAVGLSELAQDGRFLRANHELCRILGRTPEEVLRLAILDVTHPDDVPESLSAVAGALRTNRPASLDKRYLRPDGTFVWANSRVQPLYQGPDQPSTLLAVTADLTDRRFAEERLRDSEARLRLALDASRLGVWTYEPAADRFGFDTRAAEIGGVEAVGTLPVSAVLALLHPNDVALALAKLAETLDPLGSGWREAEVRFVHRDGSVHWTQARAQAVAGGDGRPGRDQRVLGTLLDITESKRTEAALRESEGRFRALASLVPALLWHSDASGMHNSSNQPWLDYTGQTLEQSQGYGWLEPIHPEDREHARDAFQAGREDRQMIEVQLRVRRRDGMYRWFLVRQTPITDGHAEVTQWFGAAMDIHDLHEMQERQAVMVAELQHRTRNLIAVVRSIAQQTMAQTGPTEQFRERFNERLAALSRVQGLLAQSEQEPITIRALIETELDALGAGTLQDRLVLSGPPVFMRKQAVQSVALALHELATNARKYGALTTGHGRIAITWRTYAGEFGGRRLFVEWQEDGIGARPQEGQARRGFGRELIENALPYTLKARTTYDLGETRLRCTIDLPL